MTKREIRNSLILQIANEKKEITYNDIINISTKFNTSNSLVFKILFGNGFILKK